MDKSAIFLLICITIFIVGYIIVRKIYTWWINVGVYIYQGFIAYYKIEYIVNKTPVFKGFYRWYTKRHLYCKKCSANGCISLCCNSHIKYVRVPTLKEVNNYIREPICAKCGIVCKTTLCKCRK